MTHQATDERSLTHKKVKVVSLNSPRNRHWWSNCPWYLMKRVLPHVAARQWLIKGEHQRVVFSIRLVAALSDPALVVCQRVMETSEARFKRLALIKSHNHLDFIKTLFWYSPPFYNMLFASWTLYSCTKLVKFPVVIGTNQTLGVFLYSVCVHCCTWCHIHTYPFLADREWSNEPALFRNLLPASYLTQKEGEWTIQSLT